MLKLKNIPFQAKGDDQSISFHSHVTTGEVFGQEGTWHAWRHGCLVVYVSSKDYWKDEKKTLTKTQQKTDLGI